MGRSHKRKASKEAIRKARREEVAAEGAFRTCDCPPWGVHLRTYSSFAEQAKKEDKTVDELFTNQFQ